MSKLKELREFERQIKSNDDIVDVKFSPGTSAEVPTEELAADVLALLRGTGYGEDITFRVL